MSGLSHGARFHCAVVHVEVGRVEGDGSVVGWQGVGVMHNQTCRLTGLVSKAVWDTLELVKVGSSSHQ